MCVCRAGEFFNIQNGQRGIGNGFAEYRLGVGAESRIQFVLRAVGRYESEIYTHLLHGYGKQVVCTAVNGGGRNHVITCSGDIENAANLPWKGRVPLGRVLTEKSGLPAKVTNDANAAAIGEMKYGDAKGMRDFIVITLGTGVGSGIVSGGNLIYGHDGLAGELGHVTAYEREGRQCGCGRIDCLETYASATGFVRTAKAWLEKRDDATVLRNVAPEELTSKMIYDAAVAGDAFAKELFEFTGAILGEAFCDFIAFSVPQAIILFGGLANAGELLLAPIRTRMNEKVVSFWKNKVDILQSSLSGADAAVLGASALGWK